MNTKDQLEKANQTISELKAQVTCLEKRRDELEEKLTEAGWEADQRDVQLEEVTDIMRRQQHYPASM